MLSRRILTRCVHSSSRALAKRPTTEESPLATAFKVDDTSEDDVRKGYQAQNPDPPSLRGLTKRWNKMDAFDQDQVINFLDDRARGDWKQLTEEERKAIWYVNYGPWGPRDSSPYDPGNMYLQLMKLVGGVMVGVTGYKLYQKSDEFVQ